MEHNTQKQDCVPIPAITTMNSLLYLLPLGKLILKLEYQCIFPILEMQWICDCKRMRDMSKHSSGTQSFICWGSPVKEACSSPYLCEHDPHDSSKQEKPLQSPSVSLWHSFTTELKAV